MSVPSTPDEEWRVIPPFPEYEVSSLGRVRNAKNKHILCIYNNNGYIACSLECGLKRPSRQRLHRLVAMAFCPKPEGKEYVNHKDENKQNNIPSNLEWVNNSENALHYYKTHQRKGRIRIRVTQPDGVIREFNGLNECGRSYGLSRSCIWGYSVHGKFWGGTIERLPPIEPVVVE